MPSVSGIVNTQFPLLFIVLKQLFVLVSYTKIVSILLSDFFKAQNISLLSFVFGVFLTQLDLHKKIRVNNFERKQP